MRMPTTRLFPLGLMLALAALTFYLDRTVSEDSSHPALRRHDPDYLVVNFTTTTYNREGAAETSVSAEKMVHYPDDDTTELHAPREAPEAVRSRVHYVADAPAGRGAVRELCELVLRAQGGRA